MDKKKQPVNRGIVWSSAGSTGGAQTGDVVALSEERYRNILENMQDSYIEVDLTGNFTYINEATCQNLGYTSCELIGKNFSIIAPGDDEIREIFTAYNKVYKTGKPHKGFAFKVLRKDGTTGYGETSISLIKDRHGRPIGFRIVGRDITERKQMEEALKESEERYRTILDQMYDIYYEVDLAGNFTFLNEATCNKLGYSRGELIGKNYQLTVPEDDIGKLFAASKAVFKMGEPNKCFSHGILHKDGSMISVESFIDLRRNNKGEAIGYRTVSRDVTEHKRAEELLRKSEERFRYVLENVQDAVWTADLSGQFEYLSPLMARIYGRPLEQMVDNPAFWIEAVYPDDQVTARASGDALKRDGHIELEYRIVLPDGTVRWILDRKTLIRDTHGESSRIAGIISDITERKKTEEALQGSEERLREILENSLDASYKRNLVTDTYDYMSPSFTKISGYTPEEMNALPLETVKNLMHPGDSAEVQRMITESFSNPDHKPYRLQYRFKQKQGPYKWILDSYIVRRDGKGQPLALIGSVSDITEQKQAEESIKAAHQRLITILDSINALIYVADMQTHEVLFINHYGRKIWGDIEGKKCWRTIQSNRTAPCDFCTNHKLLDVEGNPTETYQWEFQNSKTGLWYDCHDSAIRWIDDRIVRLEIAIDITDHRRMEEERQRVDKLESVGLLAGGIAHDFNNILTAILGNISLARMEATPGSELLNSLEQAEKASQRAKALTAQLLTFSKGGAPVLKLASLTELLKDTAGFALSGSNVKCNFSIPADLWHAEIDEGQVSQVIHNLVINAQQAMPSGGSIEIGAENIALSKAQSLGKGLPLEEGDYVRIAIIDHGIGIPEDHLEKIFDPFFTTKQKGNGMGLAISFSIAHQHGGHISVESTIGTGSTFYLYLPASMKTVTLKKDEKAAIKPASSARILVMDDESGIRGIADRLLKHIGYKNIEFAVDGAEAIKLYKAAMETGNPFTVAILDLTIPGGMGGEEAIKKLLKIDPSIKAIVSSGYIDDPVIAKYRDYGFSGLVAKPYTIEELRKAVQDVMG